MTDTLQFKNNVGETYNANVICGNIELTQNTYEITKKLFNEKTKNDNSSIFFELVGVCGNIYKAYQNDGINDITRKDITTTIRNTYKIKSVDKTTGRVLKNKSFDNAISRASMLSELQFYGVGQISVELLGKSKKPTITVQQKVVTDKIQEIGMDEEGNETKQWVTPDDSKRIPITIDGMEKLHGKTFRNKGESNSSTSSHQLYKLVEFMRKTIEDSSYRYALMDKFYNTDFTNKEHGDIKTLIDSDNDFTELFENFNTSILETLNQVEEHANLKIDEEDKREKEKVKKAEAVKNPIAA